MNTTTQQIRLRRLACGAIAVLLAIIVIILCNVLPLPAEMVRFLVDKSATEGCNLWAEQNFMWIACFLSLSEMLVRWHSASLHHHELKMHFLPETHDILLTKGTMTQIHRVVIDRGGSGFLAHLVRLLASQYQISSSVSMCTSVMETQVEAARNEIDLGYNLVRYFVWVIPTLGFIGTVRGILNALSTAASMDMADPNMLPKVIESLSTAFWTTLLALLMSCLIMFLMHIVQGKEEKYVNDCAQYCLKNFINRLYEK